MRVIITGATGMVGEGVLFECLEHPDVTEILIIGRKSYHANHPKLKELVIPDFSELENHLHDLKEYDACFYCAGISSVGMNESDFSRVTYYITTQFANTLLKANAQMVFNYVSGQGTDSTEKGRIMWARVKGKTENALAKAGFKHQYNFRPGIMIPTIGQKSLKPFYRIMATILMPFLPKSTLTLKQVGLAMIHSVTKGYPKSILERSDIKKLAE